MVSVRVTKELKDQMNRVREDWAEYLRRMIEHRIRQYDRMEASRTIDEIRSKTEAGRYSAAQAIRKDRDEK